MSRLPIMPRASRDNLRRAASPSKDESLRSNLPQLSNRYGSLRIVPPKPLGESLNTSIAGRYGDVNQSLRHRNRSPVRDALQAAQAAALETTPPSSTKDAPVFEDNDETPTQPDKVPQKRRARPSLTERTLETLARFPRLHRQFEDVPVLSAMARWGHQHDQLPVSKAVVLLLRQGLDLARPLSSLSNRLVANLQPKKQHCQQCPRRVRSFRLQEHL